MAKKAIAILLAVVAIAAGAYYFIYLQPSAPPASGMQQIALIFSSNGISLADGDLAKNEKISSLSTSQLDKMKSQLIVLNAEVADIYADYAELLSLKKDADASTLSFSSSTSPACEKIPLLETVVSDVSAFNAKANTLNSKIDSFISSNSSEIVSASYLQQNRFDISVMNESFQNLKNDLTDLKSVCA